MKKSSWLVTSVGALTIVTVAYFLLKPEPVSHIVHPKSIDLLKKAVTTQLPENYTKGQAEKLFVSVLKKLQSGEVDREKLRAFKANMMKSLQDNHLDSLEISMLLRNLQDLDTSTIQSN